MRGRAVPVTSYAIDGVHLATVTTPTSGSVTDFNYMTFSKRDLPSTSHVLAISHLNGTFWLDYFLVDGSLLDIDDGVSQSLALTATGILICFSQVLLRHACCGLMSAMGAAQSYRR